MTAAAVACGGDAGEGEADGADALFSRGTLVIETDGGRVILEVEIAETRRARATGLMGRESLPEDAGMVFLERRPVRQSFWMKNTLIPLSVAVWDTRGEILAILDMEPCQADPCPTYDPGVAWTGAVEVNQGFFSRRGIEVGDQITLERER
jgi:uncharacterized membrane protein (UPF0127 family)